MNILNQIRNNGGQHKKLSITFVCLAVLVICSTVYAVHTQKKKTSSNVDMEKTIEQDGHTYAYNKDLLNVLLIGIDQRGELVDINEVGKGGQSDTMIIVSLNQKTNQVNVISVNRDSMVAVDRHTESGKYYDQQDMQLCLQYAYGLTHEESSELVLNKVSTIFHNLPFEGYVTTNLDAIAKANDAIGGVTVTLEEDLSYFNPEMVAGATVHLDGDEALEYLRDRIITNISNTQRLERQKKYMTALIPTAKEAIKKDPTLPLSLLKELSPYIRTNLSVTKLANLAVEGLQCDTSQIQISSTPGEVVDGGEHWEFYLNTDELNQLILDKFYVQVK